MWNANGILQRKAELELVLNTRRIDVALLSETHLTPRHRCFISNYRIYRSDHPSGRALGGTAILIRSSLVHSQIPIEHTNRIQATAISLSFHHSSNITIASVYCPPRFTISPDQFANFFQSLGTNFIAGGDFNAKHRLWGSRLNNPKGRNLLHCMNRLNYSFIAPPGYTYWPADARRQPDLLDFFVTHNINSFTDTQFADELSSDHSAVLLTLSVTPITRQSAPSLTRGRMCWDCFQTSIHQNLDLHLSLQTGDEIEDAVEHFVSTVQQAAWYACTPKPQYTNNFPNYPLHIRRLLSQKRTARRTWQRSRRPADKRYFNMLNNELKRLIKEFKISSFESHIQGLDTKDGSLWAKTKSLLKYHTPSVPLRRPDGSWLISDREKCDEFGMHLTKIFKPHQDIIDPAHVEYVDNSLLEPLQLSLPPPYFRRSDVENQIKCLPKRKSPGYDLITAEVLQQLPRKGILLLTFIFNAILRTTKFPIQWKFSIIKMIHKPDKPPNDPSSYRPISLLPVCAKLFEKLLLHRLVPLVHDSNILPQHQFGFRAQHSTIHQLHRLVDFLAAAIERKHYASAVFLDISQAFDRVWIDGLLMKLRFLPDTYYLILKSFLGERFFSVSVGSDQSACLKIEAGVPQGSILSPLLYSIFTSDLPASMSTNIATYADDTALYTSSINLQELSFNLQNHLNTLETWFKKWRIKANTTKTVHITFTLRRQSCPTLFFCGSAIPHTDRVRYLGLHIDRRLTWNHHVSIKRKLLDGRLKQLYTLLSRRSKLPLRLKVQIYNSLLQPVWTYGGQVYGTAKPSVILKIQRFQSKVLRQITDAPFYVTNKTLHTDLRIPFVNDSFLRLYTKFKEKLHHNPNRLIRDIASPTLPGNPPRRLKRRWSRDFIT